MPKFPLLTTKKLQLNEKLEPLHCKQNFLDEDFKNKKKMHDLNIIWRGGFGVDEEEKSDEEADRDSESETDDAQQGANQTHYWIRPDNASEDSERRRKATETLKREGI